MEIRNYHFEEREKEPIQSNIRDRRRNRTGRKAKTCIEQL